MKQALSSVALQEIIPAILLPVNSTCLLRLRSGGEEFRSTLVASTSFIHLSAQLVKATCETLSPLLVKRRRLGQYKECFSSSGTGDSVTCARLNMQPRNC